MKQLPVLMLTALALIAFTADADAKRRGGQRQAPAFEKPEFKAGNRQRPKADIASISCDNVLNDVRDGETPRQALKRWRAENPGEDRLRNCNFVSR